MRSKFVLNVLYEGFTLIDLNGEYFLVTDGEVSVFSDGTYEGGVLEPVEEEYIEDPSMIFDIREEI